MSSTNRGGEDRRDSDAYMTDPKLARFIVELLGKDGWIQRGTRILEPSAGDGAFLRPLAEYAYSLHANDVNLVGLPERIDGWVEGEPFETSRADAWRKAGASECFEYDFSKFPNPHAGPSIYDGYQAIVGNPPFSLAESHVRKALSLLGHGGSLAFLLRLAFLESRERIPFWEARPAQAIYALAERPSFMGGRTDSSAYGVFVWRRHKAPTTWGGSDTRIKVVSWGGPDRKRRAA